MAISRTQAVLRPLARVLAILVLGVIALPLGAGAASAEDYPDAGVYEQAGAGWWECTIGKDARICTWTGVGIVQTHTRAVVGQGADDQTLQQHVCVNVQSVTYPLPDEGGEPAVSPQGGGGDGRSGVSEFGCETVPVGTFTIDGLSSASLPSTTVTLDHRMSCTEMDGCEQLPEARDITVSADWTSVTSAEPFQPTHQRWTEGGCMFSNDVTLQHRYAVADASVDGKALSRDSFYGADIRHGTYQGMVICH